MKHWLSVSIISFVLCFLIGAWWGHRLQEEKVSPLPAKRHYRIVAEKGFFPEDFSRRLFAKYQVQISVKEYNNPAELLSLMQGNLFPDLVQFPSSLFQSLQHRDLLGPLDTTRIPNVKNISSDLRHVAWDPEENFALPLNWNSLFFIYHPENFTPPSERLSELIQSKKIQISLKRNIENILWLSQVLELPKSLKDFEEKSTWIAQLAPLPWEKEEDLKLFKDKKLDLLQLSWSEIQTYKDELGDFKIWYPKEKSPFFVDFIGVARSSKNYEEAYELVHLILDPELYPSLISDPSAAAVMDLKDNWALRSARFFRQLPLTKIEPLINAGFDLLDIDQARQRILERAE